MSAPTLQMSDNKSWEYFGGKVMTLFLCSVSGGKVTE
jgi:hypothetical protein